jgi:hypothetical protein
LPGYAVAKAETTSKQSEYFIMDPGQFLGEARVGEVSDDRDPRYLYNVSQGEQARRSGSIIN